MAVQKVPTAVTVIVNHFRNTDNLPHDDAEMIGHLVTRQLGLYS